VITRSPFSGKCFISLSHTGNLVQASVILEDNS
ncbi:MAG: holo-ACP synthase, partial [Streptococcus gallolyticus]|nr:holo-ACP synthase [Streptococcus gallolyticus]